MYMDNEVNNTLNKHPNFRKKKLNISYGSSGFDSKTRWNVQRLIPSMSTGVFVGHTGSYKTFVAIAMACSVACGTRFGSELTEKGFSVLVSAEGSANVGKRVKAWEIKNKKEVGNGLLRIDQPMNPLEINDYKLLCGTIDNHKSKTGTEPSLIILDTLSQCSAGLDENSSSNMSLFLQACNRLATETGASVLLIHHTSKVGGYRGSSALESNVDFMLTIEKSKGEMAATMAIQKMKDANSSVIYQIEMTMIDLDVTDAFGEKVSSLAINTLTQTNEKSKKVEPMKVIDEDTIIIMKTVKESIMSGSGIAVSYEKVRNNFVNILKELSVHEGTAKNRFLRAFKQLIEANMIQRKGANLRLVSEENRSPVQLCLPF